MIELKQSNKYFLRLHYSMDTLGLYIVSKDVDDLLPLIKIEQHIPLAGDERQIESYYQDLLKDMGSSQSVESVLYDFVDSDGKSEVTLQRLMELLRFNRVIFKASDVCPIKVHIQNSTIDVSFSEIKSWFSDSVYNLENKVYLAGFFHAIESEIPDSFKERTLQDIVSINNFNQLLQSEGFDFKFQDKVDMQEFVQVANRCYRVHDNAEFFKKLLQPEVLRSIDTFEGMSLSPEDKRYFTKLALARELTTQYIVDIHPNGVLIFGDFPESKAYNFSTGF